MKGLVLQTCFANMSPIFFATSYRVFCISLVDVCEQTLHTEYVQIVKLVQYWNYLNPKFWKHRKNILFYWWYISTKSQSLNELWSYSWNVPVASEMSASLVRRASRRFTDPGLDVSDLAHLLSPFQIEKLSFLFKCLDQSGTGFIDVGRTLNYNQ